jgi:hypothetical protein
MILVVVFGEMPKAEDAARIKTELRIINILGFVIKEIRPPIACYVGRF